jgi:hypothetical protein
MLHDFSFAHFYRACSPVNVDNDRHRQGSFGCGYGYDEDRVHHSLQELGIEVFVDHHKIYDRRIQDQFYRDEDRDEIFSGNEPIHSNKEQDGSEGEDFVNAYARDHRFYFYRQLPDMFIYSDSKMSF